MKKRILTGILACIVIVGVAGLIGRKLRTAVDKESASVQSGLTEYDQNDDADKMTSDTEEGDKESIEQQKETLEEGSLRQQYESFEWNGFEYNIKEMRIYDSYDSFLESQDNSGRDFRSECDGWVLDHLDNSMVAVVEMHVTNQRNSSRRLEMRMVMPYVLDQEGKAEDLNNRGVPGAKIWAFSPSECEILEYTGSGLDPSDAHNACNPMMEGKESVDVTAFYPISMVVGEYFEDGTSTETYQNPYLASKDYQFFIRIPGALSRNAAEDVIDVYHDKYEVFVQCTPIFMN